MSEIKGMYLNAYYGKKFEEKDVPTAADIVRTDDEHNFKQAYRKGKKA